MYNLYCIFILYFKVLVVKDEMISQSASANDDSNDTNDWNDDWQSFETDSNFVEVMQKFNVFSEVRNTLCVYLLVIILTS